VHLDDLVELIRLTVEKRTELDPCEVFLVAEPDKMSYEELQETIGELIHGQEWPTIRIPKVLAKAGAWVQNKIQEETFIRPWMIDFADDDYPISIERAREKLGWEPKHRLRDTLPEIVARMKRDPEGWRALNGIAPGAR
jgi:nucleoside-diphosphate-sugar epimerase